MSAFKNKKNYLYSLAKAMRHKPTKAEKQLWEKIRRKKLGCKFRRQYVLQGYIVDFIALKQFLIVEVDGSQHKRQTEYDRIRDQFLGAMGFKTLRFWNHDIFNHINWVMEKIESA